MKWGQKWGLKWGRAWFGPENELYNLLPAFYQWIDEQGDLWDFLQLFSNELDVQKIQIENLPVLKSVRHCPARFLPLLAAMLGMAWDYTESTAEQRKKLARAVPEYRRRGTIPYLVRQFMVLAGVRATATETHNYTIRLNQEGRGLGAGMKISGPKWGQAVYQVELEEPVRSPEGLITDHPAGTGLYFYQRIGVSGPGAPDHAAIGSGDGLFTDPDNPPMENDGQTGLRSEFGRVRYYREAYLEEDDEGEYLIDGLRYAISETPTALTARLFRFLIYMAVGETIKEIGFFEGGSYIPAVAGNYARFGLLTEGNPDGEVLDAGTMVCQKNIADLPKDNRTVVELIYLSE